MQIKPAKDKGPRLYRGSYPSVTTVLKVIEKSYLEAWRHKVGRREADRVMRNAAAFGTRVHAVAEQVAREYAEGDLLTYDYRVPNLAPYALAIREFLDTHVDEVLDTELELVSHNMRFGGTVDLYCRLKDGTYAVVDYKTSSQLTREHGLQTAAYALLCRDAGKKVNRRMVVRIKKDKPGEYYCRRYHDHGEDVQAFLSLLNYWWWRNKRVMKKRARES